MGLVFPSLRLDREDFDVSLEQAQLLVSVYLLTLVLPSLFMARFPMLWGVKVLTGFVDCHAWDF